jgi:hypothetical protein
MVGTTGTQTIQGIDSTRDFHLSCSSLTGSGAVASVNVRVMSDTAVRIEFAATPDKVRSNQASTLTWKALNATSCLSSGDWTGNRAVEGRFETGPLLKSASYTLRCKNPTFEEVATVTIGITGTRIEWAPPSQNEDGSMAEDIAGYMIYWGSGAAALESSAEVTPGTRTWWEPDLPKGNYFFAISAFDSHHQEGEPTAPFQKAIP